MRRRRTWRRLAVAGAIGLAAMVAIRLGAKPAFDLPLEGALNGLARQARWLDLGLYAVDRFNAFQGVALMALVCAAFARARRRARALLVAGVAAACCGAVASRLLQLAMPENRRPMFDPDLAFTAPYEARLDFLRDWSSFPSDHAALLFGLACAIALVNRRLGWVAVGVAALAAVARAYEGAHYPSDLLGGALLAASIVFGVGSVDPQRLDGVVRLARLHRGVFAAAAFFTAVQAAYMFDDIRRLGGGLLHHLP